MSTNETETRARTMGWMPKEKFVEAGNDEGRWLPADQYVERGESIMPILKANNKKLADRLTNTETELKSTRQLLSAATEAIEELKNFRSEIAKEKVKERKTQVLDALTRAKKDGDTETEVRLTDQLQEVNTALKEAEKPVVKESKVESSAPQLTEESKEWMKANPWFGPDKRKTGFAMGLSQEWSAQGKALGTQEFFDHVDEEMAKTFDRNADRREQPSKVDSTNNSGGDGDGPAKGRSYADLPAAAKAACEKSADRLVGKGRAYATKEAWRKVYLEQYDWS